MHQRVIAIVLMAFLLLPGCGSSWQGLLSRQVAFDHQCPEESVQILRDDGNPGARTVFVNACGRQRMYRDLGGSRIFAWTDITDGQVRPDPARDDDPGPSGSPQQPGQP